MSPDNRPTENRVELPALTVIAFPADDAPFSAILPFEWENTGEVELNYLNTGTLEKVTRLLDFVRNAIADELLQRQKRERDEPF